MSAKKSVLIVLAAVFVLGAGFAAAQTTTHEIRQGTVVYVYGNNLVVKMSTGETKEFDVPEGFLFNVDGKEVPVSALKPGTKLTSNITTTVTPTVVLVTEVREAEVVDKRGRTLVLRHADGKVKMYSHVPKDVVITMNGKEVDWRYIANGSRITATLVHEEIEDVTEQHRSVGGSAPAAKPAPVVAAPAPKPAPAPVLPKTGSTLPLAGLGGIALLILAIGIGIYRRF